MSRYGFELATSDNDAELRSVLEATPMPGAIAVGLRREPSFFAAAAVEGEQHQVLVARCADTQAIVALGSRSTSNRYLNGQPVRLGYLSSLRILPPHRGGRVLTQGYQFLHQLHEQDPVPFYLTSIAHDNFRAKAVLTSDRAELPNYHALGSFHTAVLPLKRQPQSRIPVGLHLRPAELADQPMILEFLQRQGSRHQFFPVYTADDLFTPNGLLKGLCPQDLWLAFRGQQLVGTLGSWDQKPFRQQVLHGYTPLLGLTRPIYNLWAAWRGMVQLPRPGDILKSRLAALPLVADDDPTIFTALLQKILGNPHPQTDDFLLVGLHDSDPLLPVLQQTPARWYNTNLYLVYWPNDKPPTSLLDGRPLYLELGGL